LRPLEDAGGGLLALAAARLGTDALSLRRGLELRDLFGARLVTPTLGCRLLGVSGVRIHVAALALDEFEVFNLIPPDEDSRTTELGVAVFV
jgi:hypothetical protein